MTHRIPLGWSFNGVSCGIRGASGETGRLDVAVCHSDRPAVAAGVFTQNLVFAAPVALCRTRMPQGHGNHFRTVVASSGNANACTGKQGMMDALAMTTLVEQTLGLPSGTALVASTGVIGRFLPMEEVRTGIIQACTTLGKDPGQLENASRAILTTDTKPKVCSRTMKLADGEIVSLLGIAKGAAMIAPDMATMLGFLFTDAPLSSTQAHQILTGTARRTFNCLSIDGHTSTNDTVLLMANGASRPGKLLEGSDLEIFSKAIHEVSAELAGMIASDAEGATKLVYVDVEGTRTEADAQRIARAVANSPLVKTAIYGADPNWGRIVSAAGYAGVPFDPSELSLWMDGHLLYKDGSPAPFDALAMSNHMRSNTTLVFRLLLAEGTLGCRLATCDLTPEYVRLNSDYTT